MKSANTELQFASQVHISVQILTVVTTIMQYSPWISKWNQVPFTTVIYWETPLSTGTALGLAFGWSGQGK